MVGTCRRFGETCSFILRVEVQDMGLAGEGGMYRCGQGTLRTGLRVSLEEAVACKGEKGRKKGEKCF